MTKVEREYRKFEQFELRDGMQENNIEMYVEGYALTFDTSTTIWEDEDGCEYKEIISRNALDNADMTDVIFNYNHSGKVMARTRNKTLELRVDDKGLFIRARLDGTEEGQEMYNEIKGGYIDRMSFCFMVGASTFDSQTRTRTITSIKKVYDVSAVDIPAYDTTSISARSFFLAEAEKEHKALVSAELRKKLLLLTETF